jgi:hypothetical protein
MFLDCRVQRTAIDGCVTRQPQLKADQPVGGERRRCGEMQLQDRSGTVTRRDDLRAPERHPVCSALEGELLFREQAANTAIVDQDGFSDTPSASAEQPTESCTADSVPSRSWSARRRMPSASVIRRCASTIRALNDSACLVRPTSALTWPPLCVTQSHVNSICSNQTLNVRAEQTRMGRLSWNGP